MSLCVHPMEANTPLWQQLLATATVVVDVRTGTSGTAAIEKIRPGLRAGVQALAFHVWRNLGRAEALRDQLVKRLPPPFSDALLCIGLALAWRTSDTSYDAFTLVNQTVEAAKRNPTSKGQAGFLNACLRRFLRERDTLVARTDANPVARWNHPAWWIEQIQHDHPLHWQDILSAANQHAPLTLRINLRKTNAQDYQSMLDAVGIETSTSTQETITLNRAVPVQRIPGFEQGLVSVQDAAAQMAAPLLLAGLQQPNMRILDACAAPGGKTGHLLELGNGTVTALEIDAKRTEKIIQNLTRLGLRAQVLTADASRPQDWWDGKLFDAVLLDAPCTASGIVRRHPDVRWLRRPSDITQLTEVQAHMLRALWRVLRPGGRLLYCTCSVFLAEGSSQVHAFLDRMPDAILQPSPGHLLPHSGLRQENMSDNQIHNHDGFYYALLQKRET